MRNHKRAPPPPLARQGNRACSQHIAKLVETRAAAAAVAAAALARPAPRRATGETRGRGAFTPCGSNVTFAESRK